MNIVELENAGNSFFSRNDPLCIRRGKSGEGGLDDFNKIRCKVSIFIACEFKQMLKIQNFEFIVNSLSRFNSRFQDISYSQKHALTPTTDDISKMKLNRKFMYFQYTQPSGLIISEYSLAKWQIPCARPQNKSILNVEGDQWQWHRHRHT